MLFWIISCLYLVEYVYMFTLNTYLKVKCHRHWTCASSILSDVIMLISKVIKLYFTLMSSITYFTSLPIVCLSQYSVLVYVPGFHITLVLYFKLVFSWILMRLITGAHFHNVYWAFGNLLCSVYFSSFFNLIICLFLWLFVRVLSVFWILGLCWFHVANIPYCGLPLQGNFWVMIYFYF